MAVMCDNPPEIVALMETIIALMSTTRHYVHALPDRVNGAMDRLAAPKAEIIPMPTTKAKVAV